MAKFEIFEYNGIDLNILSKQPFIALFYPKVKILWYV